MVGWHVQRLRRHEKFQNEPFIVCTNKLSKVELIGIKFSGGRFWQPSMDEQKRLERAGGHSNPGRAFDCRRKRRQDEDGVACNASNPKQSSYV